MERDEVFRRLRGKLSAILEIDESTIETNSLFIEDLEADSIDLLELILTLKEEFGITVGDGEIKHLLAELAQFLPDAPKVSDSAGDDELAEITRRLKVETLVDFVEQKASTSG